MVFPNVNPQEVFKTESAQVEIDTVLAHPTKGFFVFNVKNQGEKLTSQKIEIENERHFNFMRMLLQYAQKKVDPIPIHSVICLLHDDNKGKFDSIAKSDGEDNRTFILGKSELTVNSFAKQWNQNLAELSNFNLNDKHFFDVAVARLVALSSLESSAALIHEQLIFNDVQATNKSKSQFSENSSQFKDLDQDVQSILESTSKIKMAPTKNSRNFESEEQGQKVETHQFDDKKTDDSNETDKNSKREKQKGAAKGNEKVRFIIWTEEQLNIIAKVMKHLLNPTENGYLRLVVTGCKGSGKTMLMVFLARVAVEVFKLSITDSHFQYEVSALPGLIHYTLLADILQGLLEPYGVNFLHPMG